MILRRTHYTMLGCFGELYSDDDFICFTLEHSYDGEPKLPLGSYPLKKEWSNKFKMDLWELKDVPNHDEIKFHVGNTQDDSDGCILVGMVRDLSKFRLFDSKIALGIFHGFLKDKTQSILEVCDDDNAQFIS